MKEENNCLNQILDTVEKRWEKNGGGYGFFPKKVDVERSSANYDVAIKYG